MQSIDCITQRATATYSMTLPRPRAETRLHLLFRLGSDSSKTVNQGLAIDTALPSSIYEDQI
jgi:hypothetical protein